MAKLEISDNELISLLKEGKEDAIALIFKKYWKPLFSSAYQVFKDKEACEDIIQDLFIRLWEKRSEIEIKISLKSYLYSCIKYEVYKQLKKSQLKEDINESLADRLEINSSQYSLEYKELLIEIKGTIEKLPPKCKEVYILSRDEYFTHKQISKKLNISTKTVENHLTKALRYLRFNVKSLVE